MATTTKQYLLVCESVPASEAYLTQLLNSIDAIADWMQVFPNVFVLVLTEPMERVKDLLTDLLFRAKNLFMLVEMGPARNGQMPSAVWDFLNRSIGTRPSPPKAIAAAPASTSAKPGILVTAFLMLNGKSIGLPFDVRLEAAPRLNDKVSFEQSIRREFTAEAQDVLFWRISDVVHYGHTMEGLLSVRAGLHVYLAPA